MNVKLLPYAAVVLGTWLGVGDVQLLIDDVQMLGNLQGSEIIFGFARILADVLLMYFGGQLLKKRTVTHANR